MQELNMVEVDEVSGGWKLVLEIVKDVLISIGSTMLHDSMKESAKGYDGGLELTPELQAVNGGNLGA